MIDDGRTLDLIDELMACWADWSGQEDYYLKVLAPSIVRSDDFRDLMSNERRIAQLLRNRMPPEDWQRLPEILFWRRRAQNKVHERMRKEEKERIRRLEEERERKRKQEEARLRQLRKERELARRKEEERKHQQKQEQERWKKLVATLKNIFEQDFLSADDLFLKEYPSAPRHRHAAYSGLKAKFVSAWAKRELGENLDPEQASSAAAINGNVLVAARAGSGKTRTLITRAIFLQKHCGVSPRELLLLAFNRAAAKEMKSRLAVALGDDLPHIMTFHALAHALVKLEEKLLFDDEGAGQLGLSGKVQAIVEQHIESDYYIELIQELMLAYFREDWQRIVGGKLLPAEGLIEHRRGLSRESLAGDRVESFIEKLVANTLFEHDVDYSFKRSYFWNGINYRPDFRINSSAKVVIECFGRPDEDDHDERADEKRKFWRGMKNGDWTYIEVSRADFHDGEEALVARLLRKLQEAGIPCNPLSNQKIWERIRKRAVDQFTEAMRNFIARCRQRGLGSHELKSMVASHKSIFKYEEMFLEVGMSVYSNYLHRLAADKEEDFNGLIRRAESMIRDGKSDFIRDSGRERGDLARLRFIMIDEFQDFSQIFQGLIGAIQTLNPAAQVFCVGDDWQAINAFAGSELCFFERFGDYFDDVDMREIATNYRSTRSVVEVSNALMEGNGTPAHYNRNAQGNCWLQDINDFQPSALEEHLHNKDRRAPAALRLLRHFLTEGSTVALLSRRKTVYGFAKYIISFLSEEDSRKVEASTVHQFKGREADTIIVLDAIQGSFPLIHPNWVFCRIFGDSPDAIEKEERRLFYVALTRAKNFLVVLTDSTRESPYIGKIRANHRTETLDWNRLPPVSPLNSPEAMLEIRVLKAFGTSTEPLKAQGYHYSSSGRYWYKLVSENFPLERLSNQPWASGSTIKVYSSTGVLRCVLPASV